MSGDQSIQVHRLVQLVVRDSLSEERGEQSRRNVHAILSAANPAEPDSRAAWETYAQLDPHVVPSRLITSDDRDAHQAVIDQIRYLWVVGDTEGSRRLAERAVEVWRKKIEPPQTSARTANSHCLPHAC